MPLQLAADIGGTFTDVVILDDGRITSFKTPTTPADLFGGLEAGLQRKAVAVSAAESIRVGTTAGINTFLERRGEPTGLITTRGFRDVYEIGRHNRPRMYALFYRKPEPLVPRDLRLEVTERIGSDGEVIAPLDEEDVARCAACFQERGIRSVAVCLLHSYANGKHEGRVAELLAGLLPEARVFLSSRVVREWREYERTSTVVLNAYVAPSVGRFLRRAEEGLAREGYAGPLLLSRSSGGLMSARAAVDRAILTLFSGPAGGVHAARSLGRMEGVDRLVSLDMGGTSTDVAVIWDGEATTIESVSLEGHPLIMESIEIHSIGAGGGSIAAVRPGGGLSVGPRSAGAQPGPASYGLGGAEPTVTDANLVLGRLPADRPLGATVMLDRRLAVEAIERAIASPLGMTVEEASAGIVRIVNARMAYAVREVTVERGRDVRTCALVAFGGAGPQHACALADLLGIRTVLIPPYAGAFSAFGMLQAPIRHDASRTVVARLDGGVPATLGPAIDGVVEETRAALAEEGVRDGAEIDLWLDMRFVGQEYTVRVPLPERGLSPMAAGELRRDFIARHLAAYGHTAEHEEVEVVAVRAHGRGPAPAVDLTAASHDPAPARPFDLRATTFDVDGRTETLSCPWYMRDDLPPGVRLDGPAVALEEGSTIVLGLGWSATISPHGTLTAAKEA